MIRRYNFPCGCKVCIDDVSYNLYHHLNMPNTFCSGGASCQFIYAKYLIGKQFLERELKTQEDKKRPEHEHELKQLLSNPKYLDVMFEVKRIGNGL